MSGTGDIQGLPGGSQHLSEEKLIAYLDGRLSAAEQHEVEEWIAREGMESDALEGLKDLHPAETTKIAGRLNHKLHKTVNARKMKRKPIGLNLHTLTAIIIILMLIIIAFAVIRIVR